MNSKRKNAPWQNQLPNLFFGIHNLAKDGCQSGGGGLSGIVSRVQVHTAMEAL